MNSSPISVFSPSFCPMNVTVQGSSSAVLGFTMETDCARPTGASSRTMHPFAFTETVCVFSSNARFPLSPRTITGIEICIRCVRRRSAELSAPVFGVEGLLSAILFFACLIRTRTVALRRPAKPACATSPRRTRKTFNCRLRLVERLQAAIPIPSAAQPRSVEFTTPLHQSSLSRKKYQILFPYISLRFDSDIPIFVYR